MARDIGDAVYGCLVGGAIGDALGAPDEGWYWTEIREKYGKVETFLPGTRGNTGAYYGGSTGDRFGSTYDGPTAPPGVVTMEHSSYLLKRAIELTMDLAYASNNVDAFAAHFYDKMLDWSWPLPPDREWNKELYFSGSSLEIVPAAMAVLYLCKEDVMGVNLGILFGYRDAEVSDGAKLALKRAQESILQPDWKKVFEPEYDEHTQSRPLSQCRQVGPTKRPPLRKPLY